MRTLAPLFFALTAAIPRPAHAWWDAGHLVTAAIAYDNLSREAKQSVDALATELTGDYPYASGFVSLATWPDDLKAEGVDLYNAWHYTLIPYNPEDVALPPIPDIDVVWAIDKHSGILDDARTRATDKARSLAFLIHFVGDIHQPLHSTTLFTTAQPGGNLGGNRTRVLEPDADKPTNLHATWDSTCGALEVLSDIRPYGAPKAALTAQEQDRIRAAAAEIQAAWPAKRSSSIDDPSAWAQESHAIAVKDAYLDRFGQPRLGPPGEDGAIVLDDAYMDNCRAISQQQLALGGYRLAERLNRIWAY